MSSARLCAHTHTPKKGPEEEVLKQKGKSLGEWCQLRRQLKDEGKVHGVKCYKAGGRGGMEANGG